VRACPWEWFDGFDDDHYDHSQAWEEVMVAARNMTASVEHFDFVMVVLWRVKAGGLEDLHLAGW
jgi:hypothetical protein